MNMGSHIPHALSLAVTLLTTTCLQADDDIESAGLGSFYTSIPAGQMGPTDTDGNPVMPQVTSDFNGPAPTNTWWSSLIWKRYPGANFGQVMHAHPLSMKAEAEGLRIGHANTSFPTGAGYGYHFTASQHALTIGVQGLQASEVKVADASDWTVTADWKDDSNSMQATFGRGLPVVRASANNGVLIVSINAGSGGASNISIEGTRVILECAGASWGLFGPDGTSWSQSGDTFLASGTNVISVALMPDTEIETVDLFTDRAMIDVQDTRVSWIWNPEKRTVDATYRFTTDSQKKPLVCLYGHQAAHADQSNMDNWGEYISARGPMMLTDCHEFTVSLPCPPVLPLLPDVGSVDTDRLEELIAQVVDDDQFASDTYWFGKGVGRHGQLALLADQIGNTVYRDQLLEVMKNELESWLSVNASSDDLSSSDRLQAEYASETYGVTIEDVNGADGQAVTGINGGDWIQLSSVNFSASLPNRALIRLASGTSGSGMVSIRLDSIDGPVIAQAGVGNTGGWTNWTELALGIAVNDPTILEGEHDVYITCDTPYAEDICTLDWFTFDYGGGGSSDRYFAHDPIWSTLIGYPASYGADQELNDHHFHYGYYIMAASVIARFDPDWARPEAWGGMIELLIKDAANWDRNDERFCFLRHLEPYVGYSYAAGHAGFAAGNNQESSSEGMNFAAAVVHWGSETGNEEIRDLGLYLMASETQAIEQYWFDVDQSVFPDEMPHPVAGIVWDSGADYATWWTGNPEEIHGINVLPVTASSLYLGQRPDSIDRCWDHLIDMNGGPPTVWQDILWSYLGLSDAAAALQLMEDNTGYWTEAGDSRARTYHWLAALDGLGQVHPEVNGNTPLSAVFIKNQILTYVAHNPGDTQLEVGFSDGQKLCVPPGETLWAHTNQDGDCPSSADIDGNGMVDVMDLLILLDTWGTCAGCPADLDNDGLVAINDLLILLDEWTP